MPLHHDTGKKKVKEETRSLLFGHGDGANECSGVVTAVRARSSDRMATAPSVSFSRLVTETWPIDMGHPRGGTE